MYFSTDSVTSYFSGSGGLSQVSWSHGIKIAKFLDLGLRGSYVFGAITKNIGNQIDTEDISSTYRVNYERITNYTDLVFTASLAAKSKMGDDAFIHYGLIYDFAGSLSGEESENLTRLTNTEVILSEINVSEGLDYME